MHDVVYVGAAQLKRFVMRWLMVVCSVAMISCEPKCPCTSTITTALSERAYSDFMSGGALVSFCLDAKCYDFLPGRQVSPDGTLSMSVNTISHTLLFLSDDIRGEGERDAELTISRAGTVVFKRSWEHVNFSAKSNDTNPECNECVQAGLY